MPKPDVVTHIFVNVYKKNFQRSSGWHNKRRVSNALNPVREHIVLGAGRDHKANFVLGKSDGRFVDLAGRAFGLDLRKIARFYCFLFVAYECESIVSKSACAEHERKK
jgi:hypothetical protein